MGIKKHSEIFFDRLRDRDDESKIEQRRKRREQSDRKRRLEAQRLIRSGEKTDDLALLFGIDDEAARQQEHVTRYGSCSFGCTSDNLTTKGCANNSFAIPDETADMVICRWTRRPCMKRETKSIREKYARLNRPV